jgi:iturin family lipopeptide synthetase A
MNDKIKLAFVYPGLGSQWKKMGAGLLGDDVFRAAIRECDKQFGRYVDWHIEEEIQKPVEISRLDDPSLGYPCSMAIEIALMELLKSRGIIPGAVIGHSGGEAAAAYNAGILDLNDMFKIIWGHTILMEKEKKGAMAYIGLPKENVIEILKNSSIPRLEKRVFIAGHDSPKAVIISGEQIAIQKLVESLTKEKVFCRMLNISTPFHSPLIERYKKEFYNSIKDIRPGKASLPIYSSLHGDLSNETVYSPSYWTEHVMNPVNFAGGVKAMINHGYTIFLEISPHPIFTQSTKDILDDCGKEKGLVFGTLKRDEDEKQELFNCFARLSLGGITISREKWCREDKQQLQLAIASLTVNREDSQEPGIVKKLKNSTPGKQEELILERVRQSIREVLNQEEIPLDDVNLGFFEMGFDSMTAVKLSESLSEGLGLPLPATLIFDYPDTGSVTKYLVSGLDNKPMEINVNKKITGNDTFNEPVAIIGMACRFPGGANDLQSFWELLKNGKDTVTGIPKERWDGDAYYCEEPTPGKSITRRGNFIAGIDITTFDAGFFKISPKEARSMDPQQRLLLEVTIEALENAAIPISSIRGQAVGVFIGMCMDDYKKAHLFSEDLKNIDAYSGSGAMFSPAAGRISYFLGIRGPSTVVNTACSSSLAALHSAVQALRNGECEMALAGGVNCLLSPNMFVYLTQLNTLSGDGTCKTFDEKADGFGRGEGCGVVVLKRLPDAVNHNDNILAVIKGSAVNHDGASTGFTAPNGIAQQEVIVKALANAGVPAESVDYIETHGAGTPLGDPIEIGAIREVYGKTRTMDNPVLVGSVKTNIGHLEGAAGAAGLIKTVLSLQHRSIPPHLHVSKPNPFIDWEHIPVKIATGLTPWQKKDRPGRAGISGFGFSGTNVHVIIEEAPAMKDNPPGVKRQHHMLNLSARSKKALEELAGLYRGYLSQPYPPGIADICYTASTGRAHFNYRFSAKGKTPGEFERKLGAFLSDPSKSIHANFDKKELDKRIVFLFTGQGSQYAGMGRELFETEPLFKDELKKCDRLFYHHIKTSIVELLYSPGSTAEAVNEAIHAQPIIFSIEYALSKLWQSWGVAPSLVMGHSIGEYAAACTAGILTLEDAVKLVAQRGKLMQSVTDPGEMVGILTSEENVRAFIEPYDDVSIAAVNAPGNVTISGRKASIGKVIETVKQAKIFIEPLIISHAFHSVMMEPYAEKFSHEIGGIEFSPPHLPIISTITGRKAGNELGDPAYWGRHICRTVRFYDSMKLAWEQGYRIYIEIGGTAALAGLASQCVPGFAGDTNHALFLPSLRKGKNAREQLLTSVSSLYLQGNDIDWQQFYKPFPGRKVVLPTYPFQRQRYWHEGFEANARRAIKSFDQTFSKVWPPVGPPEASVEKIADMRSELKEMIRRISDLGPDEVDGDTDLFSLGLDSLMLVELRRKINGKYGIDITLNEFFMELSTLNKITRHIQSKLPREVAEERVPAGPGVEGDVPVSAVERIMARQMDAMKKLAEKQLEALKNLREEPFVPSSVPPVAKKVVSPRPLHFPAAVDRGQRSLTLPQRRHLEGLIQRYTQRTRTSKQQTRAYRHVLADSKATVGFNISTKELLYPIIGKRAKGSRVWDIDDNEYIDLTMGFGVYLFGHHPGFIRRALEEQPGDDIQLGPRSYLVGEVAELISRLTGMERVAFTNTGTEAVMAAIRLARSFTGRTRIAMFTGSYHGHSDATLAAAAAREGKPGSEPVSPGIPRGVTDEVMVLDYLAPQSLEIIETYSHELAAVLVEPVQSRHPAVQPGEFLQRLRQITRNSGVILIFDEMITGFRLHPGGAQAFFGVEADICTYGKIVGGGMPIGVIAGKAGYLDGIDGGFWDYGDASYPQTERTFFGGTFCQHHDVLLTARAVLRHLEKQGPALQQELNQRTEQFAKTLDNYLKANDISMRVAYFSSLFRFEIRGGLDLFYYHLLEKGVYIWEWRNCFLSTAHTDEDLAYIVDAVKESIEELQTGGFSFQRTKQAADSDIFPMSSVQKRLYALSQTKEGQRAYHIPLAMRVHGPLAVKKTGTVFNDLIKRHDVLRTGLEICDDRYIQRVHDYSAVEFSLVYKKISGDDESIQRLMEGALQPFDLSRPPLMRISIGEISPVHFIFITNFHHNIMDGTSIAVLARDFKQLYQGGTLPPLKVRYNEYVQWEQQYIGSSEFTSHREYWLEQLAGELPQLELPTDFPRPDALDFAGKTVRFKIEREKTRQLKQLGRETGTSLNMILLALFNVLLFKLTGQEDILVGIPAAVREHGDFEHTVGMFANTLVLRNHPLSSRSLAQFLQEVKLRCLQAYGHQEFPYEELVAGLEKQRATGCNPIFDVIFAFENGDQLLFKIPGAAVTSLDINMGVTPFDLFFEVYEEGGRLKIKMHYRTSLFKEETIKRWGTYFRRLMEEMLTNPGTGLSAVEILSEEEKHTLLHDFNDSAVDYPEEKTLHRLFEEQAGKSPDNIALHGCMIAWMHDVVDITYCELNEKTNQLAHMLRQKGVEPDTIVGIMVERSIEMIIGILGILKAGGAYLPISPGFPQERVNYMLSDSKVRFLVGISNNFSGFGIGDEIDTLSINDFIHKNCPKGPAFPIFLSSQLPNFPSTHLSRRYAPATCLAYVIYTSGTTGKPRGTLITHANAARVVVNPNYIDITGQDRILQLSNYAFDGSVFDIYGALLNGAVLVIVTEQDVLSVNQLSEKIKKEGITLFFVTTALFNVLVDEKLDCFAKVKKVLFGGERVSIDHSRKALGYLGKDRVIHVYGPTETTVYATYYKINKIAENPLTIPIGKPISNTAVYILDNYLNPVPIMVYGEVYIGGEGVCRGYLNEPRLTAEKFISAQAARCTLQANKSKKTPGSRIYMSHMSHMSYIYKTGDLARWMVDGNIEFLGRKDQQIKIRGFRVELGEIESRLLEREDIKETVVILRADDSGDKYLCAYVVGIAETDVGELREYLSVTLPGYMVPAFFVSMEKIPLTSNGKIDRKALPGPVKEKAAACTYTPPRNDIEKKLVILWSKVLRIKREVIGIDENFFHLGGHSLKGTLLAAGIEKEFKVKFPLSALFQAPTARAAATFIQQAKGQIVEDIEPIEKKDYYPLSSAQKRLFFLDQLENIGTSYNITEIMKIEGNLDKKRFERAFQLLIQRHESLRTSFGFVRNLPVQRIHDYDHIDFSLGEISSAEKDTRKILNGFIRPFDLRKTPLLRIGLQSSPGNQPAAYFFFDMHHIISDGTSMGVLFDDLTKLYHSGSLAGLVPLKIQYKDFSQWQNRLFETREIKEQEEYWLNLYADTGNIPLLKLPTDYPRPEILGFAGDIYEFTLDPRDTSAFLRLTAACDVTLYMNLMAAFNVLLHKYSGQTDIIVGTGIMGRRHHDLDKIIGMFVNSLAMRNYPKADKTYLEFLAEVKENSIKAFENQDLQFEELVDKLGIERNPSRNPLFDVVFVVQNFQEPEIKTGGTTFSPCKEYENKVSKFDMTLYAHEVSDHILFYLEYSTRLFKRSTIEKFAQRYIDIIEQVIEDKKIKFKDINISPDLVAVKPKVTKSDFVF